MRSSGSRRVGAVWVCLLVHGFALAQEGAPDMQGMVDALKPRTRSLRNLVVGEAPAASAAAAADAGTATVIAPPSLSMAVRFDFDSARLRPEGAVLLERLAAALQAAELQASRFRVEGHTDAKGAADYNLRLSQQRADEVRRYLIAHGVTGARLDAVGRGALDPATPATPQAAQNRRVRIVNVD